MIDCLHEQGFQHLVPLSTTVVHHPCADGYVQENDDSCKYDSLS